MEENIKISVSREMGEPEVVVDVDDDDDDVAEFAEGDPEDGLCGGRVEPWKRNEEGKAMGPTMNGRFNDDMEAVVVVPELEML